MDPTTLTTIKTLAQGGMGLASFVVLLALVVKTMNFMDTFLSNHMHHVQGSLERIEARMEGMEKALIRLADK